MIAKKVLEYIFVNSKSFIYVSARSTQPASYICNMTLGGSLYELIEYMTENVSDIQQEIKMIHQNLADNEVRYVKRLVGRATKGEVVVLRRGKKTKLASMISYHTGEESSSDGDQNMDEEDDSGEAAVAPRKRLETVTPMEVFVTLHQTPPLIKSFFVTVKAAVVPRKRMEVFVTLHQTPPLIKSFFVTVKAAVAPRKRLETVTPMEVFVTLHQTPPLIKSFFVTVKAAVAPRKRLETVTPMEVFVTLHQTPPLIKSFFVTVKAAVVPRKRLDMVTPMEVFVTLHHINCVLLTSSPKRTLQQSSGGRIGKAAAAAARKATESEQVLLIDCVVISLTVSHYENRRLTATATSAAKSIRFEVKLRRRNPRRRRRKRRRRRRRELKLTKQQQIWSQSGVPLVARLQG
jgi:hypothetical protein